jgi:quinoprotein glucose dehydrogenase
VDVEDRRAAGHAAGRHDPARPGQFQVTPLAIGDTLFLSTPFNRVVALDAATGRELWAYDPHAYDAGQPSNGTGFVIAASPRGVMASSAGSSSRAAGD